MSISFGAGTGIKGNGMSVVTIPPYVPPALNYSVSFPGSSKIIGPTNQSIFDNTSANSWTVECWFNASAYPSTGYFGIVEYRTTNILAGWSIMLTPTGSKNILFYQWNSGSSVNMQSNVNTILLNTWYHLAVVYQQGGQVKMYLNGTSVGTPTGIDLGASTARVFNIGAYGGASYFNGNISNVRFVTGTAVYTGNFTPPTAALTAISGTSILTCNDSTIIDASPYAWSLSTFGSPSVTTGPF